MTRTETMSTYQVMPNTESQSLAITDLTQEPRGASGQKNKNNAKHRRVRRESWRTRHAPALEAVARVQMGRKTEAPELHSSHMSGAIKQPLRNDQGTRALCGVVCDTYIVSSQWSAVISAVHFSFSFFFHWFMVHSCVHFVHSVHFFIFTFFHFFPLFSFFHFFIFFIFFIFSFFFIFFIFTFSTFLFISSFFTIYHLFIFSLFFIFFIFSFFVGSSFICSFFIFIFHFFHFPHFFTFIIHHSSFTILILVVILILISHVHLHVHLQ